MREEVGLVARGISRHLGIAQAVLFDAKTGEFAGAADPVYDGSAAGPKKNKSTDEHR